MHDSHSCTYSNSYSFALAPLSACCASAHAKSAMGTLVAAWCLAISLLACLAAYRAAMPWHTPASFQMLKAMPQATSPAGSHPATSLYQPRICYGCGSPGVRPGRNPDVS